MQNKAQLYKNKLAQNKQADIESFDTQKVLL